MCESWRLKQEAVILTLPWRHQDFDILELCVTCSRKLLEGNKTTQTETIMLQETAERSYSSEDYFDIRPGH